VRHGILDFPAPLQQARGVRFVDDERARGEGGERGVRAPPPRSHHRPVAACRLNRGEILGARVGDDHAPDRRMHRLGQIYRFDDEMIVNTHVYGILAAYTPTMHLRRVDGTYFQTYLESFERVWASARPLDSEDSS
jgi:hypothetical protein